MSGWALIGLDTHGRPTRRPCPPVGEAARLRALPGANAIQVDLVHNDTPVARFEVAAGDGETLDFAVRSADPPRLAVTGRRLLRLPPRAIVQGPRTIRDGSAIDLVLIVDATRLAATEPPDDPTAPWPRHLGTEAWHDEAGRWAEITRTLAQNAEVRCAVLAFGDRPPPYPVAEDLRPAFRIRPPIEDRGFEPFVPDRLRQRLGSLPPSAGGDAVDAVAEALDACTRLPWRADARRLAILIGDSPGYSIEHPAPDGAAAMARQHDVDTAGVQLAVLGVEIATWFTPPSRGAARTADHRRLVEHARRQYRRLASLAAWAFEAGDGDLPGDDLARALADRPPVLVRGPAPGQWIDPSPTDPETS